MGALDELGDLGDLKNIKNAFSQSILVGLTSYFVDAVFMHMTMVLKHSPRNDFESFPLGL